MRNVPLTYLRGQIAAENIVIVFVFFTVFVHGDPLSVNAVGFLLPVLGPGRHGKLLGQRDLAFRRSGLGRSDLKKQFPSYWQHSQRDLFFTSQNSIQK